MSTTVTYKGDTLTTVNNNTKTLKTAGKYMEDDIVLVDTAAEGSQENDPIRFFDYDGTLVASYTEVPESLPEAPTHEGLIAQGWNWTLEDITTQFTSSGMCDIGQMYTTSDGKTRIYVTVSDMTKSFWLGLCPNGTLSIDWGDGSENSSMTGTSYVTTKTVQHTYTIAGSYIISIKVENGTFSFYNANVDYTRLLGKYESTGDRYNQTYGGCVTAIELGEGARIGDYAFIKLFNMRSVTIPNTVTRINNYAFSGCSNLKSVTIPHGMTNIGKYVFQGCYDLESVIISDTVTGIDDYAFSGCSNLKSVTIPHSMTSISNHAFEVCYSLESVVIPDTIKNIGNSAFEYCYNLKSVTIPHGVTSISSNTFSYCHNLKSITIPNTMTSIGSSAFTSCYNLESVIIPNGVTIIDSNAFSYCYDLESVTIPDTVTGIGSGAFAGCCALKSVIIPDGVTSISKNVFQGCFGLESVTIPDTVTTINNNAFASCYNMDEYHFLPITPPTLASTYAFQNIQSTCKIYVPYSEDHSILEAYKTATNWSTYASYIVEEGE